MSNVDFPSWAVKTPQGRLSYLVRLMAIRHSESGNLLDLAKSAGTTSRALARAMQRGYFTFSMAEDLVKVSPLDGIEAIHLYKPMSINTDVEGE